MRRHIALVAALISTAIFFPTMTVAQVCGGPNSPCELPDGTYHMAFPETTTPTGILMHLHGGGGTGKGMLGSGLAQAALKRGYLVVTPNGEHPENRWIRDWSVRAEGMSFDRDDVVFLQDVLADARRVAEVPNAPVLLAGFSRGGSMVWNIACQVPDFADAYAPLAGAFWDKLPSECAGPVKLFHTHGWNDRTVPLEGRSFGNVVQGDVWQSLFVLRETNGCTNRQPAMSSFSDGNWMRHWTDCEAGQIDLLIHAGGHGAPEGWPEKVLDWFEGGSLN